MEEKIRGLWEVGDSDLFDKAVGRIISQQQATENAIRLLFQYRPEFVKQALAKQSFTGPYRKVWRDVDPEGFESAYMADFDDAVASSVKSELSHPASASAARVQAPLPASAVGAADVPSHAVSEALRPPIPTSVESDPGQSDVDVHREPSNEPIQPALLPSAVAPGSTAGTTQDLAPGASIHQKPAADGPRPRSPSPAAPLDNGSRDVPMEDASDHDVPHVSPSVPPTASFAAVAADRGEMVVSPAPSLHEEAAPMKQRPTSSSAPSNDLDGAAPPAHHEVREPEHSGGEDEDELARAGEDDAANEPADMDEGGADGRVPREANTRPDLEADEDSNIVTCNGCYSKISQDELPPGTEDIDYRCDKCKEEMIDGHDAICSQCRKGGELFICDAADCPRVGHADCFGIQNKKAEWYCHLCRLKLGRLAVVKVRHQNWPVVVTFYKNAKGEHQCNYFGDGKVTFRASNQTYKYERPSDKELRSASKGLQRAWEEAELYQRDNRNIPRDKNLQAVHVPEPKFQEFSEEMPTGSIPKQRARKGKSSRDNGSDSDSAATATPPPERRQRRVLPDRPPPVMSTYRKRKRDREEAAAAATQTVAAAASIITAPSDPEALPDAPVPDLPDALAELPAALPSDAPALAAAPEDDATVEPPSKRSRTNDGPLSSLPVVQLDGYANSAPMPFM